MDDENDFVWVIGNPDIHNSEVMSLIEEPESVSVILRRSVYQGRKATPASPRLRVRFREVKDIDAKREAGLIVDSLAEMKGEPPWRRFVFTPRESDTNARLEIWAKEVDWMEVPRFRCPCCAFRTLDEEPSGTYEICHVCGWEDDNVQFDDPDFRGGANRNSLNECRAEFRLRLKNDPSLRSAAEADYGPPDDLP